MPLLSTLLATTIGVAAMIYLTIFLFDKYEELTWAKTMVLLGKDNKPEVKIDRQYVHCSRPLLFLTIPMLIKSQDEVVPAPGILVEAVSGNV